MKTILHVILEQSFNNDKHLDMEQEKPYFKHESMQNINN